MDMPNGSFQPPKSEVVYLPCRECGEKLPVNVVYVPYLQGETGCSPHRCPKKMTEMSED